MGKMKDATPFVSWLCREIKRKRLSIRQLGAESGIHSTTINRWVLGQTEPDAQNVDLIARYFDVDRQFLYQLLGRLDKANAVQLTEEEVDFLRVYRALPRRERVRLRRMADVFRDEGDEQA